MICFKKLVTYRKRMFSTKSIVCNKRTVSKMFSQPILRLASRFYFYEYFYILIQKLLAMYEYVPIPIGCQLIHLNLHKVINTTNSLVPCFKYLKQFPNRRNNNIVISPNYTH